MYQPPPPPPPPPPLEQDVYEENCPVSFRHDAANESIRWKRVRSVSPPAYERVRSAQGLQGMKRSRRIIGTAPPKTH